MGSSANSAKSASAPAPPPPFDERHQANRVKAFVTQVRVVAELFCPHRQNLGDVAHDLVTVHGVAHRSPRVVVDALRSSQPNPRVDPVRTP